MANTAIEDRVLAALRELASGKEVELLGGTCKLAKGTSKIKIYARVLAKVNNDGGAALAQTQVTGAMVTLKYKRLIAQGDVGATFWVRMD